MSLHSFLQKNTPLANEPALRLLNVTDLPVLFRLEQENFTREAWSLKALREELQANFRCYIGVELGKKLVAYAGMRILEDAEIMTIGVSSAYRRRGFAKLMLKKLFIVAAKHKVRAIFLEVRSGNYAAQNLYQSLGFKQIGTVKDYYKNPREDAQTWCLRPPYPLT